MIRKLTLLFVPTVLAAGFGTDDSFCARKCAEDRSELIRHLRATGENPSEASVCDRKAIEEASDCSACIEAYETEFGLRPADEAAFCAPDDEGCGGRTSGSDVEWTGDGETIANPPR